MSGYPSIVVYAKDEPLPNLTMMIADAVADAEARTAANLSVDRYMVKPRKALRKGDKIIFQVRLGFQMVNSYDLQAHCRGRQCLSLSVSYDILIVDFRFVFSGGLDQ